MALLGARYDYKSTEYIKTCLVFGTFYILKFFHQNIPYYRVFRSGMCFSRCLKMTEKRNLHYKTRLFCYQNLPPFHFIAINPVKIFNKCSNLTNVGSQDFAEKFDPHWYEISQIVFFTFIMVPRVHLCHSFLWE